LFFPTVISHVHLLYDTIQMPIRNAPGATADGTFSTATDGCGGTTTFGQNGVTTIVQGTTVNLHFDYGTGVNGDHAQATPPNQFWAAFVNLDAGQTQNSMFSAANQIGGPVEAPAGSTPTGYYLTVKIPMQTCQRCILSVYDQRQWGGCVDLTVIAALNQTSLTWPVGWVPTVMLAGYTESNCVAPNFQWINGTTSNTAIGASSASPSYCCPSIATPCGGRCWIGQSPKSAIGTHVGSGAGSNIALFPDGTLCQGGTICNGTLSQAFCSYTFMGQSVTACKDSCDHCTSLCATSSSVGYTNCQCIGSPATANVLALFALACAVLAAFL